MKKSYKFNFPYCELSDPIENVFTPEKHGQMPSINDGNIDPSTFSWDLGSYKNFYNSATVYLAVRVW